MRKISKNVDLTQPSAQLAEILMLLKMIADYLSYQQLEETCKGYKNLYDNIGAVDLAVRCVQAKVSMKDSALM